MGASSGSHAAMTALRHRGWRRLPLEAGPAPRTARSQRFEDVYSSTVEGGEAQHPRCFSLPGHLQRVLLT